MLIFLAVLAAGGMINIFFLLIESRIAPHRVGATMVLLFSTGNLLACCAPQISYLPSPIPYWIMVAFLAATSFGIYFLPADKGKEHLTQAERLELSNMVGPMVSLMNRSSETATEHLSLNYSKRSIFDKSRASMHPTKEIENKWVP